MVASASTNFASGTNRDVVSTMVALGSNWGRFSVGIGMFPGELSPANGVPTPGGPGFLGIGFLSDRVESLMLSFQKLPGARGSGNPVGHAVERPCVDIPLKSYTLQHNEAVPSSTALSMRYLRLWALLSTPHPPIPEVLQLLVVPAAEASIKQFVSASRIERSSSIMVVNDPFE